MKIGNALSGSGNYASDGKWVFMLAVMICAIGVLMVASSSILIAERLTGSPFYFLYKQSFFLTLGCLLGFAIMRVELSLFEKLAGPLLLLALFLLVLLLIPGFGRTVNGSTRWIALGPLGFQVSELMKLVMILYMAKYLTMEKELIRTGYHGFVLPIALLGVVCLLLLKQPDFGSALVILITTLFMIYITGANIWPLLALTCVAAASMGLLAVIAPYRMERLTTFLNPWADQFNSGYQLTQSLIAFGRGQWFGTGLGESVQKLMYLPEAHTDFLFAVLCEELGLVGGLFILLLYSAFVYKALSVSHRAYRCGNEFAGTVGYGISFWFGLQAIINVGVNMGVLPTKGLTLPLVSYGGNSLLINCLAIALLLRIHFETCRDVRNVSR